MPLRSRVLLVRRRSRRCGTGGIRAARRHDSGRHPGLDRAAGPGLRRIPLVGWTLHDSFINWDLSRSDVEAPLDPGLATKWYTDPNDSKRWIFEVRKGVKFHDGCDWNADNAIWNIERLTNDKSPQFHPVHFARQRARTNSIAKFEKVDDSTIAIYTKTVESLFPYNMAYWMVISKCALEAAGNDYKVYAKSPSGTGPYKFDKVVPRERLVLVKNPDYWDKDRVPKHDRMVLIPMPEATTRAAALMSEQIDFLEAPSPDTRRLPKCSRTISCRRCGPRVWASWPCCAMP